MLSDTKRQVINFENCCIWLVNLYEKILHTAKLHCLVKPCTNVRQNTAVDVNPVKNSDKYSQRIL